MINLIPPAGRARIVREYWIRVSVVWLFLFGTGCLLVASLLLPTYVLIRVQTSMLSQTVAVNIDKVTTFDVSFGELTTATNQARLLKGNGTTTTTSWYLTNLEKMAGTEVAIESFDFDRPLLHGGSVTISGLATTRQALSDFRDQIVADPAFSAVNLPIGNLIKDRDLLFSMNITFATSTL